MPFPYRAKHLARASVVPTHEPGKRSSQPGEDTVPLWGPEPIGAAAQDALDAQIGSRMSGAAVLIAPGFWPTSDATYVQPETFVAQGAVRSAPTALNGEGIPTGGTGGLPPEWNG